MKFKEFFYLKESLALAGNYKGNIFQRLVAASYKIAPLLDPEALPIYRMLVQKINRQKEMLDSKFTFNPTQDDPYKSLKDITTSTKGRWC